MINIPAAENAAQRSIVAHSQEAGVAKPLGTTLQLTKNLECVPHTDQNNGGTSSETTLGDHKGTGLTDGNINPIVIL